MPKSRAEISSDQKDREKSIGIYRKEYRATLTQHGEIKRYLAGELKMVEVKRVRNKRATVEDRDMQ